MLTPASASAAPQRKVDLNGRFRLCVVLVMAMSLVSLSGASCVQSEGQPHDSAKLKDLNFGPGTKAYENEMPDRPRPTGQNAPKPIPLTVKSKPNDTPEGPPGAELLNPLQREKDEVRKYLRAQPAPGKLICTALDPVDRRPLTVRIEVVAADKTIDALTDSVTGEATFELPAGRTQIYCAAGEYLTPYTNEIDLKPGENRLEVVLTQVPELSPARFGFATVAFARSSRLDTVACRRSMQAGQADVAFALEPRRLLTDTPQPDAGTAQPTAIDGPNAGVGSRFVGLGAGGGPALDTVPHVDAFEPESRQPRAPVSPATARFAPLLRADSFNAAPLGHPALWDDLYRLKQAGFLRLWLYPDGVLTRPELAQALRLPDRQYRGAEGFLAAERGPGLELLTLGPRGEGEAAYFELLNRGITVAAIAEPVDVDAVPGTSSTAAPAVGTPSTPLPADAAATTGGANSYQSLPDRLYNTIVTPRTLVRVEGFTGTGRPDFATTLAWLRAGQVQVAYGPVISWRLREFKDVVGYAAQPIPAADRLYHLDVSAFIGPGAPPEFHSIQRIELLRNGTVVATLPVDRPLQTVRDLTFEIHETASAWYMLRAYSGGANENCGDTGEAKAHWRRSWSAPIHFTALTELDGPADRLATLPVALRACRALDGLAVDAEVVVTRGGLLVSKSPLKNGAGVVQARVGDHILVGGPQWDWRETVLSGDENRNGDPWRLIGAEPPPAAALGANTPVEDARAANARLSGLGLLCPLTPRQSPPPQ